MGKATKHLRAAVAQRLRRRRRALAESLVRALEDEEDLQELPASAAERAQVAAALEEALDGTADALERGPSRSLRGLARDNLLAVVSHDVRGPLSAVTLSTTILRRSIADPQVLRGVDRIERAMEAALRVLDDVHSLVQIQAGRLAVAPKLTPARELLEEACADGREMTEPVGMHVDVELPGDELRVLADVNEVQRVFSKLIANAVRYGAPDATITLRATPYGACEVLFTVEDNAGGLAEERLEGFFDGFFHERQHDGAGLGLVVARSLVEAHGGRVWVTAVPGEGTRMAFTLPREEPVPLSVGSSSDPSCASRAPTPSSAPASTSRDP